MLSRASYGGGGIFQPAPRAPQSAAESTRRDDMAKAAAPYLHPRLSSVEHTGDTEEFRKAADMTDDELAAIASGATLHVVK